MAQVAFDTLQFVETLESSGLPKEQARAISLAVRQSHEAVDVATRTDITDLKRDLSELHHGLSTKIADIRKDMAACFEKTDAQIADVRKDFSAEIASVKRDIADVRKDLSAEIADVRKDLSAEIADVRKDMAARFEKMELRMTVKLGVMMAAAAGIIAAVLRIPV